MADLGFIKVKHEFDTYNTSDVLEIKDKLNAEFVENYIDWAEYEG